MNGRAKVLALLIALLALLCASWGAALLTLDNLGLLP